MLYTSSELLDYIRARARAHDGGQTGLAADLNCSPQYLSDVLNKRRAPGPKFLSALGLRRVTLYQRGRPTSIREAVLIAPE